MPAPYKNNACYTMQRLAQSKGVAYDRSKFYSDNQSTCPSDNPFSQMDQIFQSIGRDLMTSRLVP